MSSSVRVSFIIRPSAEDADMVRRESRRSQILLEAFISS
jgi:hypothetical protein